MTLSTNAFASRLSNFPLEVELDALCDGVDPGDGWDADAEVSEVDVDSDRHFPLAMAFACAALSELNRSKGILKSRPSSNRRITALPSSLRNRAMTVCLPVLSTHSTGALDERSWAWTGAFVSIQSETPANSILVIGFNIIFYSTATR
jgi:hypothetical protein